MPHPIRNLHTKRYAKALLLLLLLWAGIGTATSQQRTSVGFYNVENLFDTIPSPFYDDREFTPEGRNGWNTERYRHKLSNIASVIDDAGFDVIGLAEVENETSLRDLVLTLTDDYNYIHRTSSDSRGIDIALIYKGDKFYPETVCLIRSGTTREFLHVRGRLLGEEVNLVVCHMPSKFNQRSYRAKALQRLAAVADSLTTNDSTAKLVVMGDFNSEPHEREFRTAFGDNREGFCAGGRLYEALDRFVRNGFGSYCWDGKWMLYDQILISASFLSGNGLQFESSGVLVREYLLSTTDAGVATNHKRQGYPLRTHSAGRYLGGYSDHLPVFVVFKR